METHKELPLLRLSSQAEWRSWLQQHRDDADRGAWVAIAKKASLVVTLTYEQAREEALIHGWIDGLINKFDDDVYLIRFTPRRPRSVWSRINRDICEQLIAAGRMEPRGLAQVERAKADGRWEKAYSSASLAVVPDDFQAALDACPAAKAAFDAATKSQRYSFIYRINDAARDTTRARRITSFVQMLERGEYQ